jgi:hypothetical protein
MKILVALLTTIVLSTPAFSQIQLAQKPVSVSLGEGVRSGGKFVAEIKVHPEEKDTTYTLLYQNMKYSTITDIKGVGFYAEGNTLNTLYSLFKSVWAAENKDNKDYKVEFKLGSQDVIITTAGKKALFFTTDKGYFALTEKEVDQLFGRK